MSLFYRRAGGAVAAYALFPKARPCLHPVRRGCEKAAAFLSDFRDLDGRHLHEIAARPFTGEK